MIINRKRIGILGGMSYESTIKYYELILQKYYQQFHDYHYPEIIIFSLDFQKIIDLEHSDELNSYIDYLMEGVSSLENAGVSFIIMAANSPHAVFKELETYSKVPLLSIVHATGEQAEKMNLYKLLLLGIKFTMQSTFYQTYFKSLGMEVITPSEVEQDDINTIIFDELVIGKIEDASKTKLLKIIKNYGVDGIILGCTELPLILHQTDIEIPLLDTVMIHVNKILNHFLS